MVNEKFFSCDFYDSSKIKICYMKIPNDMLKVMNSFESKYGEILALKLEWERFKGFGPFIGFAVKDEGEAK
jgi:hypothetical protein